MKSIHFQLILLLTILPNLNFVQQQNIWTIFLTTDRMEGCRHFLHLLVFCLITLILKYNEFMLYSNNAFHWDGKDEQDKFCVSGLYIVTIQAEEKMATKTVVVLNK